MKNYLIPFIILSSCVTAKPCIPPPTPAPLEDCVEFVKSYMHANPTLKLSEAPTDSNDGGAFISLSDSKTGEQQLIIVLSPYVMPHLSIDETKMKLIQFGQCQREGKMYIYDVYNVVSNGPSATK